jgi:hypothetical protein
MGELWRIKAGRDGAGGFMCPPGHPAHTHTLEGFFSAGTARPNPTRPSGPNYSGSVGDVAGELEDYVPARIRAQADRLHAAAVLVCSPDWVANVYGYFRNSYSPDGADRNVSRAVIFSPGKCSRCGQSDARGPHRPNAPAPHQPYRRSKPTPEQAAEYDERLRAATWHTFTPAERPPAERHLGYLCVRRYFPEHAPDLELIDGHGTLYGTRPCVHCGATCQYEPRIDGWAPFGKPATCESSPTGRHEIDRG